MIDRKRKSWHCISPRLPFARYYIFAAETQNAELPAALHQHLLYLSKPGTEFDVKVSVSNRGARRHKHLTTKLSHPVLFSI